MTTNQRVHVTDTKFWNVLMHDVYGPRSGGAIIFLDAENARKGVAKTSAAVALARLFATAFDYDLQPDDFTLSGAEYLSRYQEQPGEQQPSVLVLDEFVGGGAGDKRRAMSQQNVDFGRAWQLLRTRRVVTIATLPDWNTYKDVADVIDEYSKSWVGNRVGEWKDGGHRDLVPDPTATETG